VFDSPHILKQPTTEVLAAFRAHQTAISAWFAVMALSAALFAPIAVGVGRLATGRTMRIAVVFGIAAAVVQVIGLSRWPLLVSGFAARAASTDPTVAATARESFATAHQILGHLVGETFGYLFTAVWTLLVLSALRGVIGGRIFTALGGVAAVLILAGVLSPLNLPGVDLANFVGYVLWSVWLVFFAVLLLRRPSAGHAVSTRPALTGSVR
jgi:hypothetical protein